MSRLVGDRYPNYFSGRLTLSATDTFTTDEYNLPIVRPTSGSGRVTIIEALWVDIYPGNFNLADENEELKFGISVGATPTAVPSLDDGNTIMTWSFNTDGDNTADASIITYERPWRYDLTDKNGFGQLIATDKIHISGNSDGQTNAVNYQWRMYYRYVTVGAMEYVGIVQSTTSG